MAAKTSPEMDFEDIAEGSLIYSRSEVAPYAFEPLASSSDTSGDEEFSGARPTGDPSGKEGRLGNTDW